MKKYLITILFALLLATPVTAGEGDVNLIAKIAPQNDGFVGMVEAEQVIAGTFPGSSTFDTNLTINGDLQVDTNSTTTGSTYAGTSLGLSTVYITDWTDLESILNFGTWSTTSEAFYWSTQTTDDLSEGSNLYWTDQRFDTRLIATTTWSGDLTIDGNINSPSNRLSAIYADVIDGVQLNVTYATTTGLWLGSETNISDIPIVFKNTAGNGTINWNVDGSGFSIDDDLNITGSLTATSVDTPILTSATELITIPTDVTLKVGTGGLIVDTNTFTVNALTDVVDIQGALTVLNNSTFSGQVEAATLLLTDGGTATIGTLNATDATFSGDISADEADFGSLANGEAVTITGVNARNNAMLEINGTGASGGNPNIDVGLLIDIDSFGTTQNSLHIKDAGLTILAVDGFGVGIGTSAPARTLDVVGDIFSDTLVRSPKFMAENAGGSVSAPQYSFGDSDTGIYWIGGNKIGLATGATNVMTWDDSQRVGIGTENPGAVLDVRGDGLIATFGDNSFEDKYFEIRDGGSGSGYFGLDSSKNGGNGAYVLQAGTSKDLQFVVNSDTWSGTPAMSILYENSFVGIGTDNPQTLLHIQDTTASGFPAVRVTSDGSNFVNLGVAGSTNAITDYRGNAVLESNNGGLYITVEETGGNFEDIFFGKRAGAGVTEIMTIDTTNDRVGIGTVSPGDKLTVVPTGIDAGITVRESDDGNDVIHLGGDGFHGKIEVLRSGAVNHVIDSFGTTIFNETGDDIDFRVEGDTIANLLRVDAGTDRIGIGTGIPLATLDVRGKTNIGTPITAGVAPDLFVGINSSATEKAVGISNTDNRFLKFIVPGNDEMAIAFDNADTLSFGTAATVGTEFAGFTRLMNLNASAVLALGIDDSVAGTLILRGTAAAEGGEINIYNAGNEQGVFDSWNIDSDNGGDLRIFTSDGGATALHRFANDGSVTFDGAVTVPGLLAVNSGANIEGNFNWNDDNVSIVANFEDDNGNALLYVDAANQKVGINTSIFTGDAEFNVNGKASSTELVVHDDTFLGDKISTTYDRVRIKGCLYEGRNNDIDYWTCHSDGAVSFSCDNVCNYSNSGTSSCEYSNFLARADLATPADGASDALSKVVSCDDGT